MPQTEIQKAIIESIQKSYEAEPLMGQTINWRFVSFGFMIGRGMSVPDAVAAVKDAFDCKLLPSDYEQLQRNS